MELSAPLREALGRMGWSPGRRVDVSEAVNHVQRLGYSVGPAAMEFLQQCSGLSGADAGGAPVELTPRAALAWLLPHDRPYVESVMGEPACPVGHGGQVILLVGISGRATLLKDDWLGVIDTDGLLDALERLLAPGEYPERWRMLDDSQRPYDCRDCTPSRERPLVLYAVRLERGQHDADADAVLRMFERCGFSIRVHEGVAGEPQILEGALASHAAAILLCPEAGQPLDGFRPLVQRVRASERGIIDVLAVGTMPEDVREGGRGVPFFIHPSEGDDRMRWLARLVAGSSGVQQR